MAIEEAPDVEVAGILLPASPTEAEALALPPEPPDVHAVIADAATRWGLAPERLLRIAWCESRWDPNAYGYGGHLGLFQFSAGTWAVASAATGYGGASPFDPHANTEAAAWLMATDGFHHWGCR